MADHPDVCMTCGQRHEYKGFGNQCEPEHITVHQEPCHGCGVLLGIRVDDDYCGAEGLYCTDCINAIMTDAPIKPVPDHPFYKKWQEMMKNNPGGTVKLRLPKRYSVEAETDD